MVVRSCSQSRRLTPTPALGSGRFLQLATSLNCSAATMTSYVSQHPAEFQHTLTDIEHTINQTYNVWQTVQCITPPDCNSCHSHQERTSKHDDATFATLFGPTLTEVSIACLRYDLSSVSFMDEQQWLQNTCQAKARSSTES